jgi:hypothetical protein
MSRSLKNLIRDPGLLRTQYVLTLIISFFCGALFEHVTSDIAGFQNRMGVFFFICTFFAFNSLSAMEVFFIGLMARVLQEIGNSSKEKR